MIIQLDNHINPMKGNYANCRQEGFLNKIMSSIKQTLYTLTGSITEEEKKPESPDYPPFIDSPLLINQSNNNKQSTSSSDLPKVSRSDYIQSKQKKVNSIVQITQYIANSKYNDQSSNIPMCSQSHLAFRAINNQSSSILFSQPKSVINYNDFNIEKIKAKPTIILNHKHPRDADNDKSNDMPLSLSQISNRKINKNLINQISLNYRIKNNTIESNIKSFDEIKSNIEKKTKANEQVLNKMRIISKPKYELEERKKKYREVYQSKKSKPIDYDYQYLDNESENMNNTSHLSIGYGEKVMYKGKNKSTEFKLIQNCSLNYEKIPKPILQPQTIHSLLFVDVKEANTNTADTKSLWSNNTDSNAKALDKEAETEKILEIKKEGMLDKPKEMSLFKFQPLTEQSKTPIFLCGDSSETINEPIGNHALNVLDKKIELFPHLTDNKTNKEKTFKLFEFPSSNSTDDKKSDKDTIPLSKIPETKSENNLATKPLESKEETSLFKQQTEKMKIFLKDETTNPTTLKINENPLNSITGVEAERKDNKPQEQSKPLFPQLDKDKDKVIQKPTIAIEPKKEEIIKKESVASQLNSSIPTNSTLPQGRESLFNINNPFTQKAFDQQSTESNPKDSNVAKTSLVSTLQSKGLNLYDNKPKIEETNQPSLFSPTTMGFSSLFNQPNQKQNEIKGPIASNQPNQNTIESQMEISPVSSPKITSQTKPTPMPFQNSGNSLFQSPGFPMTNTASSLFQYQSSFSNTGNNSLLNQPTPNSIFNNNKNPLGNNKSTPGNYPNVFSNIKPTNIGSIQNNFPLTSSFGDLQFSIGKK